MAIPSSLTSFQQLVTFLVDNHFPHNADVANQVVELPSKAAPLPGNLYIRWEKKLPFLQMIHFMIDDVPEERVKDIETAICRLNYKLEVPGFGFDYDRRRLYCRFTIPVFQPEGINPLTLNQLGQACVANAKELTPAFQAVIEGKPADQIEQIVLELAAARQAAKSAPQA